MHNFLPREGLIYVTGTLFNPKVCFFIWGCDIVDSLTILHLSDLHIKWNGDKNRYPRLHGRMLEDIKQQSQYYTSDVVIVVTGDLVDQGNYSDESQAAIISFFTKLRDILNEKIIDIFIIPGNHDKNLSCLQKQISFLIKGSKFPMNNTYEDLLSKNVDGFRQFQILATQIYSLFGDEISKRHIETIGQTYGADLVETKDKKVFCFISLNTALNSSGSDDYRNLRLGKFQMEKISRKMHTFPSESDSQICTTIALAHHPVNWLVGEEEDAVQNLLLSPAGWNANLYICGHVHQRDAISWHNAHHSLTTLMTGFGWPDAGTQHSETHLYSVYVLNLSLNSMDIYVRSTNDGGTFIPDFRFYGKPDHFQTKIVYPIDSNATHSYIELSRNEKRSFKALFLNENFVKKQQQFCNYLCLFQNKITKYQLWCIEEILIQLREKKQNFEKSFQGKDFTTFFDFFMGFLQSICQNLIDELSVLSEYKDSVRNGEVRCHLRNYFKEYDQYVHLCSSYGTSYSNNKKVGSPPRPMVWESLIKESFEANAPLIYSINLNTSIAPSKKWKNFITFIPKFRDNIYVMQDGATRPLFSMGISCKSSSQDDILRLFEFVRIDEIIGAMISNYVKDCTDLINKLLPEPKS